ncbi:MAG: DUF3999 family protein [Opitutaceae bacterium]|jgi:hypothetical protein
MRKTSPKIPDLPAVGARRLFRPIMAGAALLLFVAAVPLRALESAEWQFRQSLAVNQVGVIKLALPPATLDAARAGLEDLRLLDPSGRETPFLIEHAAPRSPAAVQAPRSFRAILVDDVATQLLIETGTNTPLAAVTLATPASNFLKAARVEVSSDGEHWKTLESGAPVFRQFGAEQLRLDLARRSASRLRITIDDLHTRPVPFTGASLALSVVAQAAPTVLVPGVRITRRDEFSGETVFTLNLGTRHLPLAALEFATNEPLFTRRVSVGVSELRDEVAVEKTLATGTIYRIAAEGLPSSAKLDVPLHFTARSRELLVHVANGDSPPLAIDSIGARQRPIWLVFRASVQGRYSLLTGNAEVAAPRYDITSFAATLREAAAGTLAPGDVESNPGYHRRDVLAETVVLGAPLDPAPWRYCKAVQLASGGVQQLELDLDVLAHAQSGFGDLRLVRDGSQVPYLLERPVLSRAVVLALTVANDPQHPSLSRWEIKLPRAGLPLRQLTLTSSSTIFQRRLRLFEKVTDERNGSYERTLADVDWSKTLGGDRTLVLSFSSPPATDTLVLQTDNGDNPPLVLDTASAAYPVTRLLFKTDAGPLTLYYGNRVAIAPRYDLALVAAQILAAEKNVATLSDEEKTSSDGWPDKIFVGTRAGILFWGVLALVVIALLVIVAKLLPKPPEPSA